MSSKFATIGSFSDRFNLTEAFRTGVDAEAKLSSRDPKVYLDWISSEVSLAISSMAMISAKDGKILANTSKQLHSQEVFDKYAKC